MLVVAATISDDLAKGVASMNRAGILAAIALAFGCGGPSAAGGGSGAIADAAGSGGATTGNSGGPGMAGGTTGSSTSVSGQSGGPSGSGGTGALDAAASDPKTACEHYIQVYCERQGQCQNLDPSLVTICQAFASLCPDFFSRREAAEPPHRWRRARSMCWQKGAMISMKGSIFRAKRPRCGSRAIAVVTILSAKRSSARTACRAVAERAPRSRVRATTARKGLSRVLSMRCA
jgi:hypothetical protein